MSQMPAPANEADEHSSFIKTPQQLITVVLLAFLVPIFGIVLILQIVVGGKTADPGSLSPAAVSARIQPIGRVEIADSAPAATQTAGTAAAPAAPAAGADGKKVYDSACSACHAAGVAGAPKLGDKAAWAPRLKTGMGALVKSVIGGKGAMPPKGGNSALGDAEVKASVEYMVGQSK